MWCLLLSAIRGLRQQTQPILRRKASSRPTVEALEDRTVPSFLPPVTTVGGGGSLAVGDFNHDGRADIVVIDGKNELRVSLSNGDGTFTQSSVLGSAKGKLVSASASDVNGDGNLDLIALGYSGSHSYVCNYYGCHYVSNGYKNVWLGNGDGSFLARPSFTATTIWAGTWPPVVVNYTLADGDFNRDGITDSVTLNTTAGTVDVYMRNTVPALSYAAGANPVSVAVGDVNGDGWSDLIVVNSLSSGSSTLSVLFNDGTW